MRSELQQRLNRARDIDPDVFVKHESPFVIEIESESDNTYTLVPNTAYCSCADRQYREYPCKHLLHLALHADVDREPREACVSGFKDRADYWNDSVGETGEDGALAVIWTQAFDVCEANDRVERIQEDLGPNQWDQEDVESFLEALSPDAIDDTSGPSSRFDEVEADEDLSAPDRTPNHSGIAKVFDRNSDDSGSEEDAIARIAKTAES